MYNFSWMTPYKGEVKTLRFFRDPRRSGLGHYEDTNGVRWHIYAIIGEHVNARPINQHPGYYGTSSLSSTAGTTGFNNPVNTWIPYRVEVVKKGK